ncbi:MAG: hypothetical protein ACXVDN_21345, partial [Ktedonobacteraceae bacterium]
NWLNREKAVETILVALAYVGLLAVLVLVGMLGTLYFYIHGALGINRFREVKGLRAVPARSVPYQVSVDAEQSEIEPGNSTDSGTRYARVSMLVTALVLLIVIIAIVSAVSASLHL